MPIVMPAFIAWYRNTEWIASRTASLPRNENETFDIPPEACRAAPSDLTHRLDEVHAIVVVLVYTGGDGEEFGSKIMSFGFEIKFSHQQGLVAALAK